jgi:TolB-like protein
VKENTGVPQTGDKAYQQRKKIKRLVVGQFTYNQGFNQLTKTVQEKLVTAFAAKGMQVVERDKLERVLQEQQLGYSGLVNVESAKKIGALLGAEGMILGTVNDMGNDISLNGRMVDIGNGDTLSAGEVNLVKTPLVVQLLQAQIEENSPATSKATPAASNTTPGVSAQKDKKQGMQEVEGIEFAINGCKKSGSTVTCDYTLTNKEDDVAVICYASGSNGSELYDDLGNQYGGGIIKLANCESTGACERTLISGVPTHAALIVRAVSLEATSVPKTSIGCIKGSGQRFTVIFRNIKLN